MVQLKIAAPSRVANRDAAPPLPRYSALASIEGLLAYSRTGALPD